MSNEERDWMVRAKCRGTTDYDLYESDNRGSGQADETRLLCSGCPVFVECARWGVKQVGGMVYAGIPVPESPSTPYYAEAMRKLQIFADLPTEDER